jgi:hypothetical protein
MHKLAMNDGRITIYGLSFPVFGANLGFDRAKKLALVSKTDIIFSGCWSKSYCVCTILDLFLA